MKIGMDTATQNQLHWRARDAWLCVLVLLACQFMMVTWLRFGARQSLGFYQWLKTPYGLGFTVIIQGGLFLFVALWFSRAADIREFVVHAGLQRGLTLFGWCAAWLAVGLIIIDGYGGSRGWTASSKQPHPVGYDFSGGAWWFFVLKTVLIVPFYEEVVTRGFLYRAFRGSYGVLGATFLIICFSTYFHWGSVSRSLFTFLCLASLWGLLCFVRERTGSLWDCLLGHAVFNAFGLHLWFPSLIGMALLSPFAARPLIRRWQVTRGNYSGRK